MNGDGSIGVRPTFQRIGVPVQRRPHDIVTTATVVVILVVVARRTALHHCRDAWRMVPAHGVIDGDIVWPVGVVARVVSKNTNKKIRSLARTAPV